MFKLLLLLFLLASCSKNPSWDLAKPIYVNNELNLGGKEEILIPAIKAAISNARGVVYSDPVEQILTLVSTDEEDCSRPQIRAYTHIPDDFTIHVCRTFTLSSPYTIPTATLTFMHELGHELAGRSDHLDCSTHSIMTASSNCGPSKLEYTSFDVSYICSTGNTINGLCK